MTKPPIDVAIVGGGASGVLLAIQLLRQGDGALRVTLVERRGDVGPGTAYATPCRAHLLNTRAGDMSALPDEPDHFVRWLERAGQPAGRHDFVPRSACGDYLRGALASAVQEYGQRLGIVHGEAVSAAMDADGVQVGIAGAEPLHCRFLVLATGHRPPSVDRGAYRGNPWAADCLDGLDPGARVLLIGTGLTMIDVVASLMERTHRGPILAVSRRGLLPRPHAAHPHPLPGGAIDHLFDGALSTRLARFRSIARTARHWTDAMQALRPRNGELWRGLSEPERRRFLRHLRPWWDVHRHRVAPEAFASLLATRESGQLSVIAGRVQIIDQTEARISVSIARRGAGATDIHAFDRVIDCRGVENSVDASTPLSVDLLARSLLVPDALNLGIAVDDDDAVLTGSGEASKRLYALGPPTRGRHWEITAIPDIRSRAARLAGHLLRRL